LFFFYAPKLNTLLTGDTIFLRECGVPAPSVSFNPQGKAMIKDMNLFKQTVRKIQTYKYDSLITLHGELGSILFKNASSMVSAALEAVMN